MKLLQPVKVASLFTLSHALPALLSSLSAQLSSLPAQLLDIPTKNETKPISNTPPGQRQHTGKVKYSNNWSGMVLSNPPSKNDTFTDVSAEITIPHLTADGPENYQAASIWVGIDGATAPTAILQTGVQVGIIDGKVGYNAWYQWYPSPSTTFPDFKLGAGDTVAVRVYSLSPSSGVAVVENKSTGQRVSQDVHAPDDGKASITGQNAEWILEDFQYGGHAVALVDFSPVDFMKCEAKTEDGEVVGVGSGSPFEMVPDSKTLATVQVNDDQKFVVRHA